MNATYWHDDDEEERRPPAAAVLDLCFDIDCRCLPVDHAHALREALARALPWLEGSDDVGVHPIHGGESGNGWMRPEGPDAILHLSRRTKLMLRLPEGRVDAARGLSGQTLSVAGYALGVGKANTRALVPIAAVFARHVVVAGGDDEAAFLKAAVEGLRALDIVPKKMLCGREVPIATPTKALRTRSLMLADLTSEESIRVQLHGLGPHRQLGCGLFIGHKDIKAVTHKAD